MMKRDLSILGMFISDEESTLCVLPTFVTVSCSRDICIAIGF